MLAGSPSGPRRARVAARLAPVVLVALLVVGFVAPVAQGQVPGRTVSPEISVVVPDPTITPGETQDVTFYLKNDADLIVDTAATATSGTATLRAGDTPITVLSGTKVLDDIENDDSVAVTFRVRVPETIDAGTYRLPLDLEYEFTKYNAHQTGDPTLYPRLRVEDRARFVIDESSADVSIGNEGTLNVTVRNAGSEAARDATLTLTSQSAAIRLGGAESDGRYLGTLEVNESEQLEFDVSVGDSADRQRYALAGIVEYEDAEGNPRESLQLSLGVHPRPEQAFAVRNVESTLEVGTQGTLSGEVVNLEGTGIRNAVVVLQPTPETATPTETEYAVGNLAVGERARFAFEIETSETADSGPRQFNVRVRYRDSNDERLTSDLIDLHARVRPERETFSVEPVNASVPAGGARTVSLRVTNEGGEPLTDISAKLFTNDPLSSSDDEAYISRLPPGESRDIVFSVSAGAGALRKSYPVSVDFQYDDADGDTLLSDSYRVAVGVTEPEPRESPVPLVPAIGGVGVLVLAGAAYVLWRRRTG